MTIKERNQQLRVVAEILLVHIPEQIKADPELTRDLLSVAGTALEAIAEDAEKSAKAWDKRAYDLRADELRREWAWAAGAANYTLGVALRPQAIQAADIAKIRQMIGVEIEKPGRRQIPDPTRFRGAAKAIRMQQTQRKKPVRE
jgi:hypothetical protein